MKTTLLEVSKKAVFPQFLENPSDDIDVSLAWVLGVDEDVIEVNNDKDIKFLDKDLVNGALEAGRGVGQPKRHYLVLDVAVSSPESRFLFIALFYPHPIVNTCEVELGELFCLTQSI